jgi:hypothetical protein
VRWYRGDDLVRSQDTVFSRKDKPSISILLCVTPHTLE